MKKKGFTYIEVMIAFAIFALIFTYVMKLNKSSNVVMRDQRQRLQMVYIAQMELERFKSELTSHEYKKIDGYYVMVETKDMSSLKDMSFIEVKVTVKKNINDSSDKAVTLNSRVFGE